MATRRRAKTRSGFAGVYPMLYAFYDKAERLDRKAIARQTDALIEAGVHGIAVLGVASEVNRMSLPERRLMLDWVAETVDGRVPLCVTVGEPSVPGQIEFVRAAKAAGADWCILQTPPVRGASESSVVRFFGAVAEKSPLPLGMQIAPEYLGMDMSGASLRTIARHHANMALLKVELQPMAAARLVEETEGRFDVFNGRAGQEMTYNLDAGCVGIIPGAETGDVTARIFSLHMSGRAQDRAKAETVYREIAPLLTFFEHSMDHLLVYGKRLMAKRLRLPVATALPRRPYAPPHKFGLALVDRLAETLPLL
jgi:2-keto-3-deoxy-L-arabinonate dehydratase